MHSLAVVLIDSVEDVDTSVGDVLRPYALDNDYEHGFWDWWQIGGRWTGAFDDYEPAKDPLNKGHCTTCNGKGVRILEDDASGCVRCAGTGSAVKWPTGWERHAGDCQPVRTIMKLTSVLLPTILVTPDGVAYGDEYWDDQYLKELSKWPDMHGVIVDCHS